MWLGLLELLGDELQNLLGALPRILRVLGYPLPGLAVARLVELAFGNDLSSFFL